jgi:hypothetical protein
MLSKWPTIASVGLTAVVGLLFSGCGAASVAGSHHPREHPRIRVVSGGSSSADSQGALLTEILAGVKGADISGEMAPPPSGFDIPSGSVWLELDIPSPATSTGGPVAAYEPGWAAELVAGAFRDASAAQGYPSVIGYSLQTPGDAMPTQATRIDGTVGDVTITPQPDPTLEARIMKNAASQGLDVQSITMFHPLGPAALVVASSSDANKFAHSAKLTDIFGQLSDYDGVLLIVSDSQGPALVSGVVGRLEHGVNWLRSDISPGHGGDAIGPTLLSQPPSS